MLSEGGRRCILHTDTRRSAAGIEVIHLTTGIAAVVVSSVCVVAFFACFNHTIPTRRTMAAGSCTGTQKAGLDFAAIGTTVFPSSVSVIAFFISLDTSVAASIAWCCRADTDTRLFGTTVTRIDQTACTAVVVPVVAIITLFKGADAAVATNIGCSRYIIHTLYR